MQFSTTTLRKPTINITSLIDVLFLLLTFFLVSTSFIEQSALKVELPSVRNSDQVAQERRYVLNVGHGGELVYNGDAVQRDDLKSLLGASAAEVDAAGGLVLRADQGLPYGDVMSVLDLIKGAGIKRFVIATSQPSE